MILSKSGFTRLSKALHRTTIRETVHRLHSSEVSQISDKSAQVTWAEVEGARSYRFEYIRDNTESYNMEAIASPRVSLKNLVPGALYKYKISSICGPESITTILYDGNFSTTKAANADAPIKAELTELSRLEIRVGKIIEIGKHPEADNLYVEKVDVGEAEHRTIVSGLVEYCPIETLQGSEVVVLCNLKPRALKGITSFGMLLCSSSADHTKVEPLRPPAGVSPGQLITFAGHLSEPAEPGNRATKAYTKIAEEFFVNDDGVATFNGIPFMTSNGPCTSTLKACMLS